MGLFAQLCKERVAVAVATENLRPRGVTSAPVDANAQQCIEGGANASRREAKTKGGKRREAKTFAGPN